MEFPEEIFEKVSEDEEGFLALSAVAITFLNKGPFKAEDFEKTYEELAAVLEINSHLNTDNILDVFIRAGLLIKEENNDVYMMPSAVFAKVIEFVRRRLAVMVLSL